MNKNIFLISGMHRSGTSYLAHALSFLGLELPSSIQEGYVDNPKGHFESFNITHIHDELLKIRNLKWDTIISPDDTVALVSTTDVTAWLGSKIESEFSGVSPMLLKDPRMSLLLPLWESLALERGLTVFHILPFRHPLEVAASLEKRNQICRSRALLVWLNYFFNAEENSRGRKRTFVCFPQWTEHIASTIEKIENDLGVFFPEKNRENIAKAINEFETDLVHHQAQKTFFGRTDIECLCLETFDAFLRLVSKPNEPDILFNIDELRKRFEDISLGYREILREVEEKQEIQISVLLNQIEESNLEKASLKQLSVNFNKEIELVRIENASLKQENESLSAQFKADIEALNKHIASLKQENESLSAQFKADIEALNKHIASLKQDNETLNAQFKEEIELLKVQNQNLVNENNKFFDLCRREQLTVLKPMYRNIYRYSGRCLRRLLPSGFVEYLKKMTPSPIDAAQTLTYQIDTSKNIFDPSLEFNCPAENSVPDIFIFSIINWDFRYQRPQHIAKGLAEAGHRVFYIEMESAGNSISMSKISKNLFKVRLSSSITGKIEPYTGKPSALQVNEWLESFFNFCNAVKATSFKQVIIQHPFWWQLIKHLSPEFQVIFDCMDDMSGFSNTNSFLLELEEDLLQNADKLVVSSQCLFDKYKHFQMPTIVRNGTDLKHFSKKKNELSVPDFLKEHLSKNTKKIMVGYVGAIAEWFDGDLVRSVAHHEPDFEFHLCGAVNDRRLGRLGELDNVFMHGEVPYRSVPGFLGAMDVMIIPFKIIPIIQACDPVKFYEYSAIGKPTVTTALPELSRASDLPFFASTPSEFAGQIRNAYAKGKSTGFRKKLKEYAAQNTWSHRIELFSEVLGEAPKVSVVILSYGDPELTMATLHSLFQAGAVYPNLEILIVDNGSPRSSLQKIRDFAENFSNINVIENGDNLGFAKGNNVGLKAATGDYVMLLNNDTVVAPGSVYAMVRHLQHNPNIGVVGPLTNNIGNEAKLFVEYENLEQMRDIARQVTTGYRGVSTRINVVAYFAVMFRRADLEIFGLLSEDYGRGMFEDDDHCAIIRSNGYTCVLAEDAFVHHHLSATFNELKDGEKEALFEKNKKIYEKKWGKWIPHQYRKSRPSTSCTKRD
jgi:GT2 family glycosyltransferase